MGKNKRDMKKEGYEEIKQDVFRFENIGDTIEGELVSKKESDEFQNMEYRIIDKDDVEHIVYGTVILDSLMENVDINVFVCIEFIGENPAKKEGHNPTKLFKVWKKEKEKEE